MSVELIVLIFILILINFIVTRKIYNNYKSIKNTVKQAINIRDEKIKELKKEQITLLENAQEDREKIRDLENNIDFLVNNLSKQKRELVRPANQN
jgi:predicted Holliday junction resolvase-like endonuclease